MANQQSPPSPPDTSSENSARKRVGKACDRCRLKKSKCDGASPCSRCKADNAICMFGERKKSHDKVYPKGYVEMLEQQQAQLVAGLQELYKRAKNGEGWSGAPLKDSVSGHPLTHDILEQLGALTQDGQESNNPFEEDVRVLQQRLYSNGAAPMYRQPSVSSDSDHDGFNSFESPGYGLSNPIEMGRAPPTPPRSAPFTYALPPQPSALPRTQFVFPTSTSAEQAPSQRQSWTPSTGGFFDEGTAAFQKLAPANIDFQASPVLPQSLQMSNGGPCLVPELDEDEEFKTFFNQTVV